ncbi:MAG TPA: hypothetical protein VGB79_14650 [Allosphingosinicella sp.]
MDQIGLPAPVRQVYAHTFRMAGGSALVTIEASTLSREQWDRLAELQRSAQTLLSTLDEAGLHQAAAYVSMALDVMRQSRPDLLRTG